MAEIDGLPANPEPLMKTLHWTWTTLLLSESTREMAGAENFAFRRIGDVQVRGRHSATTVYTIDPEDGH